MPLIALDCETGGFVAAKHALLSLAMVELDQYMMPTDRRLSLYILPEPGMTVEDDAARVNGYTPEKWEERGAVPLKIAMGKAAAWLPQDSHALAFNAQFDKRFVNIAEAMSGIQNRLGREWVCAYEKAKALTPVLGISVPNHKLGTLATLAGYQWGPDGAHTAIEDALACAKVYKWLISKQLIKEAQDKAAGHSTRPLAR